ncbi:MAG: hypothetical protein V1846_02005 [Candidatus Komeilibacteria bacterium]
MIPVIADQGKSIRNATVNNALTMIKKIGFIGQGWLGKNYADWYEKFSQLEVIRYSLEEPHISNKDKIGDCDLVFICVPTPTTPEGFDYKNVDEAIGLVGDQKIALIKSTILPGTTEVLQKKYPNIKVLFSPEFLTEATAAYDVANPDRNIIGYASEAGLKVADEVMALLPSAPYKAIIKATEAEMIKYGGNCWFYYKVVFINLLYDLSQKLGLDYDVIKNGLAADKRIGATHLDPIHHSGRGAGGSCFIKDFEAFRRLYNEVVGDEKGKKLLEATVEKNLQLLEDSKKDEDLRRGVYGIGNEN